MIAIIILNYNTSDDVIKCVESIRENTHIEYIIYIVDNKSNDDSLNKLIKFYKHNTLVKILSAEENEGYSAGNNIGIKAAISDGHNKFIICNPDVVFHNNCIDLIIAALDDERVGVAGPLIFNLDGTIFNGMHNINYTTTDFLFSRKPLLYINFLRRRKRILAFDCARKEKFYFNGMVSGCCFAITKKVLEKIGFFDENVFIYYEEMIMGKKFMSFDIQSCIEPKASIIHAHSVSINKISSSFAKYHDIISALYFLRCYNGLGNFGLKFCSLYVRFNFWLFLCKHAQSKEMQKKLKNDLKKIRKFRKNEMIDKYKLNTELTEKNK